VPDTADRVRVGYPDDGDTGAALRTDAFRRYLRVSRAGTVSVGDEWDEFVNCGCGTTRRVTLRVEAVEGGTAVGGETAFAFDPIAAD
jgi:hypothetical protein